MKNIAIIITVVLSAVFSTAVIAEVNIAELVKNHPVQADYPLDESVILYESIQYNLSSDGKLSKRVHRVRTMFTENALDKYGDPAINFVPDWQDLNVEICRGYMLDGKVVDTWKDNGFNQITPDAVGRAPDYTIFQQMICTHTGLEWGSTSELLYTLSDKAPCRPWIEGIEYFQSDEPIVYKEVSITVPENIPLLPKFINGDDGDLRQTISEGMVTRTWTVKNSSHLLHDDSYNYRIYFAPTLIFSTCPDWKFTGEYFARGIKEASQSSDYLKAEADKVIEDRIEPYIIVERLAKLVREKVRTINHSDENFKWFHRSAERTLSTRYGSPFDKALLLVGLLKTQGLSADLAVSAKIYPDSITIPHLGFFDSFWVRVKINGEDLFLNPLVPLSEQSRKNLAGNAIFFLDYNQTASIIEPSFAFEDNKIILNLKVKIAEDGSYTGSGYFRVAGCFSPYYQVVEEGITAWMEGKMKGILPNLKVTGSSAQELMRDDCKFTFDFTGDKIGESENGYLTLQLPTPPISITTLEPSGFKPFLAEREKPVYFKNVGGQMVNMTLELPEGWSVASKPENIQKESSIGSAILNFEIKNSKLNITAVCSLREKEFHSDNLLILRNLHLIWEKKANNYIVLKTK